MRTKAFLRPASCAVALAAFVAAAAIGAPGPALAASCGVVSSGSSVGSVHPPSTTVNTHSGATAGSTHGSSSCGTPLTKTVTASVAGGIGGTTLTGGTGVGSSRSHEHHANWTTSHAIKSTNTWVHHKS
jgi:hypothetical protein